MQYKPIMYYCMIVKYRIHLIYVLRNGFSLVRLLCLISPAYKHATCDILPNAND